MKIKIKNLVLIFVYLIIVYAVIKSPQWIEFLNTPHQNSKMQFDKSQNLFPKDYKKLNTDKDSDIDWNSYMKRLEKILYKNWKPIKSNSPYSTVVLFSLDKDGNLLESKITKESHVKGVDEIALKTIQNSAPFEKLPDDYNENSVEIYFQFDYKAYGLK